MATASHVSTTSCSLLQDSDAGSTVTSGVASAFRSPSTETSVVHASDEWYLTAGEEIPEADFYENYPQIENGVGMIRSLLDEFTEAFSRAKPDSACRDVALATGRLMAPILRRLFEVLPDKFPNTRVTVYDIRNDFFGESITVAGLLTGRDIIAQLTGLPAADRLLLPSALLRSSENVLLDDVTVSDIEKALQTTVRIVKSDGTDLLRAILGRDDNRES